jgi:L-alanine-DL-glutamate epimerase-like enolase superfamily enzyme
VIVVPDITVKWNDALPAFEPVVNLVRVVDGDGRAGYASTWLPGGRHEVADAVAQFVRPVVVGRSATERESIWQALQHIGFFTSIRAAVSAVDIALWDLAAKTVDLPLYQFLGAARDRLPAYASGLAQPTPDAAAAGALAAQARGLAGYKLHTFGPAVRDIDACRAMRAAVGDDFALILDPVNSYDRHDARRVGRVLDELGFEWFEAPLPDDDVEGYVELCRALDVPVANGEVRVRGLRDYAELVRMGAVDIVRVAADVQGGLTTLRKAGGLAEASSRRLEPRAYGTTLVQAAHLHWALSVSNCRFFEVPDPKGYLDFGMANTIEPDADGFVRPPITPGPSGPSSGKPGPSGPSSGKPGPSGPASGKPGPSGPSSGKPGLGIAIDWDAVDDATVLVR